jgi:hypothetical protein
MDTAELAASIITQAATKAGKLQCAYISAGIEGEFSNDELATDTRAILTAAAKACSFFFRPENTQDPFGPKFQCSEGRSPIPKDLNEDELAQLQALVEYLLLIELKPRILDVLWLRERDSEVARRAIEGYMQLAAKAITVKDWTLTVRCLERGIRLASLFRKKHPEIIESVVSDLETWSSNTEDSEWRYVAARSIRALCQFGESDPSELFAKAKAIAEAAQCEGDFSWAEECWLHAIQCARNAKNNSLVIEAQTALAELYLQRGQSGSESSMSAAHWLEKAFTAYKAIPGTKEIRETIYQQMRSYQQSALEEMTTFEEGIEISDLIAKATETVGGLSAMQALLSLAFRIAPLPNYEEVEKQALELAQMYPLSSMFAVAHLDEEGKIVAKTPGGIDSDQQTYDREVYKHVSFYHQTIVHGSILPAISVIEAEHYLTESDLLALTLNNSFIQPGQERLYAKLLIAGLHRDFIVAIAIGIPALESSLRYVLHSHGVRVSTLNASGIQEAIRLPAILSHSKAEEVFGANLIRDLKGLLLERTYGNLRNRVSHGLFTDGTFHQPSAVYLWWLILRLCLTPYIGDVPENNDATDNVEEI